MKRLFWLHVLSLCLLLVDTGMAKAEVAVNKMIGIAEIPQLLGSTPYYKWQVSKEVIPFPIAIYSKPEGNAEILWQLQQPDHIELVEYGYEIKGAKVYGQVKGWYQIKLTVDTDKDRLGWITAADAGKFISYYELLPERLTYLRTTKGLTIAVEPGGNQLIVLPENFAQDPYVEVLDKRIVNNTLWIQVRILAGEYCESEDPKPWKTVWIPGYLQNNETSVWFFSRGC